MADWREADQHRQPQVLSGGIGQYGDDDQVDLPLKRRQGKPSPGDAAKEVRWLDSNDTTSMRARHRRVLIITILFLNIDPSSLAKVLNRVKTTIRRSSGLYEHRELSQADASTGLWVSSRDNAHSPDCFWPAVCRDIQEMSPVRCRQPQVILGVVHSSSQTRKVAR